MLTPEQENLLTEIYDLLLKLYVFRKEAKDQGDWDRVNALEKEIIKVESQRISMRQWLIYLKCLLMARERRGVVGQRLRLTVRNRQCSFAGTIHVPGGFHIHGHERYPPPSDPRGPQVGL